MEKGNLMFVPSGGLANRMRAIASAYALTQQIGSHLEIVWFQDWALNAPFNAIFQSVPQLNLREATLKDKWFYDRARRKNLWLPSFPQWVLFDHRLDEKMIWPLMTQQFDFADWARGHRCYISSYMDFWPYDSSLLHELLKPVKEITEEVERNCERLQAQHVVGIHIRRTDHVISIEKSPTSLFVDKMQEEIEQYADTRFFLATDSNDVKEELKSVFGSRIVTPESAARRCDIDGIRGGLTDMYTLAATSKIYGSLGSTFSKMASRIGGVELWFLEKGKEPTLFTY
jgi:hypothetical protein